MLEVDDSEFTTDHDRLQIDKVTSNPLFHSASTPHVARRDRAALGHV
jgi:hypothetical protein